MFGGIKCSLVCIIGVLILWCQLRLTSSLKPNLCMLHSSDCVFVASFSQSNNDHNSRYRRFFTSQTLQSYPSLIMKVLALLCSLFAIVSASSKPTFVTAKSRALDIRGGAAIGPLDEHLAVQLAKAGAAAYVAGAGSKFVADKTGASSSQVCAFIRVIGCLVSSISFLQ